MFGPMGLYPMTGMGSNGSGMGGSSGMLSPDVVARIMQMQGGGGAGGPMGQQMIQHQAQQQMPMQAPQAMPQQPQQQNVLSGIGGMQGLTQLLQQMKGGQSGLQPQQQGAMQQPGMVNGQGGGANSIPQWMSMIGQYLHPYGATGNGMPPIAGANGMMGGGT